MAAVGLSVANLEKVFGEGAARVEALKGLSFDVAAGRFATFVGPSGSGKTTLLRILAGLERPTRGEVHWRQEDAPGRHASGRPPEVAMVFQEHSVFPWLTVRANVGYGLWVRGVARAERERIVDEWLRRMGLEDFARAYPHQLSGGMRQRVGVARAFALDPDVLLMDEPFSALDAQTRLLLQEELLELWQGAGKTVLFVTHSIDEALLLSDVVFVLSRRPARVLDRIDIPWPRPRDVARLKRDERYGELYQRIWQQLGHERPLRRWQAS
ncbi:MAG TPA: ABC transporter ATP-binding protein [Bacillota bacterium]